MNTGIPDSAWIDDKHALKLVLSGDAVRVEAICPLQEDYPWRFHPINSDQKEEIKSSVQCGGLDAEDFCIVKEEMSNIGLEANGTGYAIELVRKPFLIEYAWGKPNVSDPDFAGEFWFKALGYPSIDHCQKVAEDISSDTEDIFGDVIDPDDIPWRAMAIVHNRNWGEVDAEVRADVFEMIKMREENNARTT